MSRSSHRFNTAQQNLLRSPSRTTPTRQQRPIVDDSSDDESETRDTNNTVRTPVRANQQQFLRGLANPIFKQLLTDIEERGGLDSATFNLSPRLCNQKPDLYGHRGTPLRRQVQNRTTRLRSLTTAEYNEFLIRFKVASSRHTQLFDLGTSTPTPQPSQTPPRSNGPSSTRRQTTPTRQSISVIATPPRHLRSTPAQFVSASRINTMDAQVYYTDFDIQNVGTCNIVKPVSILLTQTHLPMLPLLQTSSTWICIFLNAIAKLCWRR